MKQLPMTPKQLAEMKALNASFIGCIFQMDGSFKKNLITPYVFHDVCDYTINKVHLSGHRVRVMLEFIDGDIVDIYRDIDEVYKWIAEECG